MEIRGWVHDQKVCVAVGEVEFGLTEQNANRLLSTVEREMKVLCPSGFACDECDDTGELWVSMGRGAVSNRDCDCQRAARR